MSTPLQKSSISFAVGAVFSAFLASACCLGPLLFALIGLGGVGMFHSLSSYRSYFLLATFGLLGVGFYLVYRKPSEEANNDCGCEPKNSRGGKLFLWSSVFLVVGFLLFPYVEPYFLA